MTIIALHYKFVSPFNEFQVTTRIRYSVDVYVNFINISRNHEFIKDIKESIEANLWKGDLDTSQQSFMYRGQNYIKKVNARLNLRSMWSAVSLKSVAFNLIKRCSRKVLRNWKRLDTRKSLIFSCILLKSDIINRTNNSKIDSVIY